MIRGPRKLLRPLLDLELHTIRQSPWCPLADVYRIAQGWLVKLDLAGVRREDIQLNVTGCCLTVQGVRRDRWIQEGQQSYSVEIAYNQFRRTIELPCIIEQAHIVTDYDNGILLIRLETEPE